MLLQFALAALVLALTPGPSIVLLLAVGADRGPRAGVTTALGLAVGTSLWGVVVAAGLGTVLAQRPGLLQAVTALGGCYLLWLAVQRVHAARHLADDAPTVTIPPARGAAFRDGVVVNLLNPGLAVFLAAIVPPFLAPDAGPVWSQVLVLSSVLVVISTMVNTAVGLAGAAVGRRSRRWVGGRSTVLAAAGVYAALGVLALTVAALR